MSNASTPLVTMSRAGFDGGFDLRCCPRGRRAFRYGRARKYPEELLERGTRLVFESGRPIAHVARDLGIDPETLRKYVRRTEADEGKRKDLLSSQEHEEIKQLRREVAHLRRANEILKAASVFFAGELDPHRPK
jgi:transposase